MKNNTGIDLRCVSSRRGGFTIVELLIVVVVIAILATITIVAYNGVSERARVSAVTQSLSQARTSLETYKINNGLYPLTGNLSAAGIANDQVSYQYYSPDGSSFCLTGAINSTTYYTNATGYTAPVSGSCLIKNYYVDPQPANTSTVSFWSGNAGNVATYTATTSTWSTSGKANRMAWTAVTNNNGGPAIYLANSYNSYIGQTFTVTADIRLISGTAGLGWASVDRDSNAGTMTWSTGGTTSAMVTGQTYRVYATFSADSAATAANLRFYILISGKSSDAVADVADIDLYPGQYDPQRRWYSGNSPAWAWNGTANNSSSTGPAL